MEIGKAERLSDGDDVTLLAVGRMVEIAGKAANDLAERGVSAGVVNARWVKPIDPRIIEWTANTSHVVTLEDNVLAGGFGSAVMETFASAGQAKQFTSIGVPDQYLPFGVAADVMKFAQMDPDSVVERVLLALGS